MNKQAFDDIIKLAEQGLAVDSVSAAANQMIQGNLSPPSAKPRGGGRLNPGYVAMESVQNKLHDGDAASPRGQLSQAMTSQTTKDFPWRNDVTSTRLLRQRNMITRRLTQPNFGSADAVAFPGTGRAFSPLKAPPDQQPLHNLGHEGTANHEFEHAYDQSLPIGDTSLAHRLTDEVGPSVGDLIFMGERYARQEGKPLQHTVQLPGGKRHDINWMRQQAQRHGYWRGRPMTDLIFNTTEGRQWYNQMVGGEARKMQKNNAVQAMRKSASLPLVARALAAATRVASPAVKAVRAPFSRAIAATPPPIPKLNANPSLLRQFVSPAVKPREALVAKAKPIAPPLTRTESVVAKTRKLRDYVANVPRGESFLQRPVANIRRLLTLDGIPGIRRLNQAALATAGYGGASAAIDTNRGINDGINAATRSIGDYLQAPLEQRRQFRNDMHGAKRQFLSDQTLGRAKRMLSGSSPRAASQDAAVVDIAKAEAARQLKYYTEGRQGNVADMLWKQRTPMSAALSRVPGLASKQLGERNDAGLISRLASRAVESKIDLQDPTQLEQVIGGYFGSLWNSFTPEQKRKIRNDVSGAAAGAAAGVETGTSAIR